MAEVALTEIRHGRGEEGTLVFPEGTPVDKMKGLSKETIAELKEAGAIGAPDVSGAQAAAENAALQAQIDELKAALEAAQDERDEALEAAKPPITIPPAKP